jgi:hypothetical protein
MKADEAAHAQTAVRLGEKPAGRCAGHARAAKVTTTAHYI